ncbi:MAG: GFA family protein [Pseudomonadota bacterium]
MAKIYKGSCLCGGVTYELEGPLRPSVACHCKQCRKTSGHYWSATNVPLDKFKITRQDNLKTFRATDFATRWFCASCGSSLFWKHDDEDSMSVASGTLDDDEGLETAAHIFVAHKGHYYQIEPGPKQRMDPDT